MYERSEVRQKFYNSRTWRRLSKSYAQSKAYICEKCANRHVNPDIKPLYKQFHVHHIIELTDKNISDANIALNWDNLQLLCLKCHNDVTSQREVIAPGLMFDEDGMIRKVGDFIGKRKEGDSAGH